MKFRNSSRQPKSNQRLIWRGGIGVWYSVEVTRSPFHAPYSWCVRTRTTIASAFLSCSSPCRPRGEQIFAITRRANPGQINNEDSRQESKLCRDVSVVLWLFDRCYAALFRDILFDMHIPTPNVIIKRWTFSFGVLQFCKLPIHEGVCALDCWFVTWNWQYNNADSSSALYNWTVFCVLQTDFDSAAGGEFSFSYRRTRFLPRFCGTIPLINSDFKPTRETKRPVHVQSCIWLVVFGDVNSARSNI